MMGRIYLILVKRAWKDARPYMIVTFFKSLFSAAIPLINIGGLGVIVNSLVNGKDYYSVLRQILIFTAFNLFVSLSKQLLSLLENRAMRKASDVLQLGYMQDTVDVDYHYAQNRTLINLKQKSMTARPAFFLGMWGQFAECVFQFAGCICAFLMLKPLFCAIIVLSSVLIVLFNLRIAAREFEYNKEKVDDDRKMDYLYMTMTDYRYAKEVRINNADEYLGSKYMTILRSRTGKLRKLIKAKMSAELVGDLLTALQTLITYLYGTWLVINGELNIAEYTVLIASTTLFASVFISLFTQAGTIRKNASAITFLEEYDRILEEHTKNTDAEDKMEECDFSGADITFENVTFRYPGGKTDVLSNVSFTIKAHEKTALVGLNGAGKTTIIMLMLRLYEPTEGRILVGGRDIKTIPYRSYSSRMAVVLQDFTLFAYSIKENIVFDKAYDGKRLNKCIEESGIGEKLQSLKNGTDTSVYRDLDRDGIELSGGEGQKLALARAMYKIAGLIQKTEHRYFTETCFDVGPASVDRVLSKGHSETAS